MIFSLIAIYNITTAGNMWTDPVNVKIARRHINVEIGTEAAHFPEKEYIHGMFVAVCGSVFICTRKGA
jgi:hypothetical protein